MLFVAAAAWTVAQESSGVVTGPSGKPPVPAPKTPPPKPAPAPSGLSQPGAPVSSPSPSYDPNNPATLPYAALIKIAQTDANQADASQPDVVTVYTLKISSKQGIPPSLFQLHLDRKSGPQKLEVDQFGFFQVPYNKELVEENPNLVTNQPKGSLNLQVKLSLDKPEWPKPVDGQVTYQSLFDPVLKLNKQMQQVDPLFGEPDQQHFAIRIKSSKESTVKIIRSYGARTLAADEQGHIWLIYEKLLYEENPKIHVPAGAEFGALPITPQQAMAIRDQ